MRVLKQILFTLVFIGLGSFASFAQGEVITGSIEMCEGSVHPIKLEDIVGLGLSAGGGSWAEVNPDNHAEIIADDVSNIFLGIDRLPGTYVFVFTPNNNPCLEDGDLAVATIYILPIPTAKGHTIGICAGETVSFDLSSLVSQELKDMYTITYKDALGNTLPSSVITIDAEGALNYTYHLTGGSSDFCVNYSTITLAVVANGVADVIDFTGGLSYCAANMPATVNLNEELGLTSKDGVWSAVGAAPAITAGVIQLTGVAPGTYNYVYAYKDCDGNAKSKNFDIIISEDLSTSFNDAEASYCKTINTNGIVDLMNVLGIGFPPTSGTWTEVSATSPVDVADGIFELADARVGTYVYRFTVSNAIDLCGVSGESADVTLKIFDSSEVLDGEVQLCKASLVPGSTLDLNEFMPSLPSGGTWYGLDGNPIVGSTIDVSNLGVGVYSYTYEFDGGPCGTGNARLLVVVTDMLTNFKDKTKKYCLTDAGTDHIDLDQILGVGNLTGVWTNNNSVTNFDTTTNVFNGAAEGVGTYTFTFKATEDACGVTAGDEVTITVIITEDLTL